MKSIINTSITNPIQLIAFLGQVINQNQNILAPEAKMYAMVTMAGLQTLLGILQAYKNPDGTDAQAPWYKINGK